MWMGHYRCVQQYDYGRTDKKTIEYKGNQSTLFLFFHSRLQQTSLFRLTRFASKRIKELPVCSGVQTAANVELHNQPWLRLIVCPSYIPGMFALLFSVVVTVYNKTKDRALLGLFFVPWLSSHKAMIGHKILPAACKSSSCLPYSMFYSSGPEVLHIVCGYSARRC